MKKFTVITPKTKAKEASPEDAPKGKRKNRYDVTIKVDATMEEILRATVAGNPKSKRSKK